MMSDICITTSISELLRCCDSPSSCKQVFFFFPASCQYHTSSHFASSQLSGGAVTFLGFISLSHQNIPSPVPGSWCWRSESPNQRSLTQLSTWATWDVLQKQQGRDEITFPWCPKDLCCDLGFKQWKGDLENPSYNLLL